MAYDAAVWICGTAAVLQGGLTIAAIKYARRLVSYAWAPIVVGISLLMAVRRVAEAALPAIEASSTWQIIHGSAGLAVSVLFGLILAKVILRRYGPPNTESPTPEIAVTTEDLIAARNEEREVLCYDLHDGLAQFVLAAQMHLDTFAAIRATESQRAENELEQARARVREAVREVHRLIAALSRVISPESSLSEAVGQYLERLAKNLGWSYEFKDGLKNRRFLPSVERMLFRTVQEALTNAAKHARTDRVSVTLETEGEQIIARVQDWGVGFDPQTQYSSRRVGLRSMCNRARLLGGSCEIESSLGQGTRVTIRVPCGTGRGESA